MSSQPDPYHVEPGDLITAQLFNGLQDKIKKATTEEIDKAIKALHKVDQSGDSDKLGGSTPDELEERILKRALAEIPKRTGYKRIFKRLEKKGEPEIVYHGLRSLPLVDVYQLDYFEVICGDDEEKENKFVNFYLYHSDETELKSATPNDKRKIIIESSSEGQFIYKIKFVDMLKELGITYTQTQSLGDVVTEFWQALFKKPNDKFDVDQYCNSPWFEKCCGENRSMQQIEQRDNVDELWFQMRPRKTINFPYPGPNDVVSPPTAPSNFPNNVEVVHLDFDNIGVKLLDDPFYATKTAENGLPGPDDIAANELKIMLLLKV
jgi:hypothetical protein